MHIPNPHLEVCSLPGWPGTEKPPCAPLAKGGCVFVGVCKGARVGALLLVASARLGAWLGAGLLQRGERGATARTRVRVWCGGVRGDR